MDINDLTIVLSNFGTAGMSWSQGEFTGDGTVDINDLTIVLASFGATLGSSAAGIGRRAGAVVRGPPRHRCFCPAPIPP